MCSVIEIKSNDEYYISYHSPDSMVRNTPNELKAEPEGYKASLQGNHLKPSKLNNSTNSNCYMEEIRIVFV